MRKTLVTLALAGTLGLTGTALLAPSSALAQAGPAGERVSALKSALAGLVTDGTITSAQADRVATALAEQLPPRGHHRGHDGPGGPGNLAPAEVAKALGITVEDLRAERRAGKTLAQVAEAQDIEKADLIARLVTAGKARLAAAVADGRLTQARADELTAGLQARVTEQVDQVGKPGKPGKHDGRHADGAPDDAGAPEAPEPDSAPSGS